MEVSKSIEIELCNSNVQIINSIRNLIIGKYEHLFFAVIAHGSVGTNEVIPFSDFDGLLIVNDEYIDSKLLKEFKKKSMTLIYKFDPLQHHNWFQMSKSNLSNYPQEYFPNEILSHSKLIYPTSEKITINMSFNNDEVDYKKGLLHIISLLELQMETNWDKENLYELKGYLSKIMLLPSLYYSAIFSEGIFKKDSFKTVKKEFTPEEWKVIESASKIRKEWNYNLSFYQKWIMSNEHKLFRKLTKLIFAPKISKELAVYLNNEFKMALQTFIHTIMSKI
ncbi:hypothetical protein [Psychroserpens sp.]